MTAQEAINKVWQHFVVDQNPASYNHDASMCMYRQSRQNDCEVRCAVGVLIPDEQYDSMFDSTGDSQPTLRQLTDVVPALSGFEVSFLRNLQLAHDTYFKLNQPELGEQMRKELNKLAKELELTTPDGNAS